MGSFNVSNNHPLLANDTATSPIISAYQGRKPSRKPVWFMRQAGRSLPEYHEARKGVAMLDACLQPELAAEITMQPVRRHDVDAAIFFSDIVTPLKLAGVNVDIVPGVGPVIENPVKTASDVKKLPNIDAVDFTKIQDAIKIITKGLGDKPLIGFAGAPFTVAAYLIEGKSSRNHLAPRTMMHADPKSWKALSTWMAELSGAFLQAQIEAGVSAVQLFDSWAGALGLKDYEKFVAPASSITFDKVAKYGVPKVHFGTGTSELLVAMKNCGADVMGVDYRLQLQEANKRLGGSTPLQGNIDPAFLAAGKEALFAHTAKVIEQGKSAPGHVVNLGHGVPPSTDPQLITDLVAFIHEQEV
ncbi:MAG: uroporphyrinogen decarboxylase [Micrococcaceae bacterium]